MTRFLGLIAALLLAHPVHAHGVTVGDLEIIHPNIPQPASSAMAAAGYMGISNAGDEADRLIGVESTVAQSAMLHKTEVNADGVASMAHVEGIDIPANDTVVLESGGYHIMLMGLTQELIEGQMVPGVLIFEKAGRVEMEFAIDPPGGVDHSTMDHSAMGAEASTETASAEGHGDGHGHGHGAAAPAMTGDDPTDIEALLKAQFDTPEAPLTVAPITVQGDVAIAGWSQDGRGGRAFLRKDAEGWFVELCSGAGLMLPATLQGLGLTPADAETLLVAARAAEDPLGTEAIQRFDSFDGTLMIGRAGHGHSD
jgi:copper(I)-binding protein